MNKDFLKDNTSFGYLTIKATKARGAIPVTGMDVSVSTTFNDEKIVVFNGITDDSGLIEHIKLPAPKMGDDNLEIPNKQGYQIYAYYKPDNFEYLYNINIYEGLNVIQNINVLPNTRVAGGVWQ